MTWVQEYGKARDEGESVTQPVPSGREPRLRSNLRRLSDLVDSAASVETSAGAPKGSMRTLGRRIADHLPLSHATGRAAFLSVLEQGRLLSSLKLQQMGSHPPTTRALPTVEAMLGTDNSVFTYAAPFRYPETSCGLLFKTELERSRADHAVATPFDSGGTIHYLRPQDSTEDQVAFVHAHELPVPGYRLVLGRLLDHFFLSPWDYIEGSDPIPAWPIPVEGGDWRRWTFEIRFKDEVRLTGVLLAVFLPVAVASERQVVRQVVRWRREGVAVRLFRTPNTDDWQILRNLSVEYLKEYLVKQ